MRPQKLQLSNRYRKQMATVKELIVELIENVEATSRDQSFKSFCHGKKEKQGSGLKEDGVKGSTFFFFKQ